MKIAKYMPVLLLLGVMLLQGCEETGPAGSFYSPAESLSPMFSDQDVVFDPELPGEWQMEDGSALTFTAAGANGYEMSTADDQTVYEAHLVRLQGDLFLDIAPLRWPGTPASQEMHLDWAQTGVQFAPQYVRLQESIYLEAVPGVLDNAGTSLKIRTRPAHWFLRVSRDGGSLKLIPLNQVWLARALGQGSINIDHVMIGKEPLLTARAPDLRHLILEHGSDAEAFAGEWNLHRKN
jgi:hypothetical protein